MKGDKINYYLHSKNVVVDTTLRGYSGSPVFIKQSKSNTWRIIGLLSSGSHDTIHNKGYLVIPNIQNSIDNINSKH